MIYIVFFVVFKYSYFYWLYFTRIHKKLKWIFKYVEIEIAYHGRKNEDKLQKTNNHCQTEETQKIANKRTDPRQNRKTT